ncbi:hypothetical protein PF005_g8080 [Phytophthora fragariae]|uniref:Secreted protein n=1 Tax=Phytophthora fragariae TaxID=53985 RepID=A0A6A3YKH9_9STRA|nr:hypothetical protein PF003_g6705 [Phytophthora fragariae]KAE8941532.1 hypothetical protein PF009_g8691 [Phytophthora fragariae]KAE9016754.1 hypothetical protein PF011_g7009 [Phytophthora fragariae]KAE9120591.1 hypothetical protein PF010_g7431 [Phytophthora fragariae]KAE9125636.1 hypothetical protein PF007_g6284 [Phytophthora fragariae]
MFLMCIQLSYVVCTCCYSVAGHREHQHAGCHSTTSCAMLCVMQTMLTYVYMKLLPVVQMRKPSQ